MGNNIKYQNLALIVTGSSGLVASMLKRKCAEEKIPFFGIDLNGEDFPTNILEPESLDKRLAEIKNQCKDLRPVLFHFAAAVLSGNNLTSEQIEFTRKLNVEGTENVIDGCQKYAIPLVHISTDFVFSGGEKSEAYLPSDKPISDKTPYVDSKIKAEEVVLSATDTFPTVVVRLAFPYGNLNHQRATKGDLLGKMLSWMDGNKEVNLFADQHICPTPLSYFAEGCLIVAHKLAGQTLPSGTIIHLVGKPTTPYDFGMAIKEVFNKDASIVPMSIKGKGVENLVLDTSETETILGLTIPEHRDELTSIKEKLM